MAEPKTQQNDGDVDAFLAAVEHDQRREDAIAVRRLMAEVTGEPGAMWGDAIVGFRPYHYRYDSGREGDWPAVGFSPRKQQLVVYLMTGFEPHPELMARLGKHSTGKSCLYIKRLSDIDLDVLRDLVAASVEESRRQHVDD
ncbi:MAG TPA: DUF1801 domain-containing protein [Egicoccus sp.]|nr:DUF1801 domain-containing protein [Egicoccus sp.]HSK22636.1 DUF1801 domain-containing protein [Egicoccus sp.]